MTARFPPNWLREKLLSDISVEDGAHLWAVNKSMWKIAGPFVTAAVFALTRPPVNAAESELTLGRWLYVLEAFAEEIEKNGWGISALARSLEWWRDPALRSSYIQDESVCDLDNLSPATAVPVVARALDLAQSPDFSSSSSATVIECFQSVESSSAEVTPFRLTALLMMASCMIGCPNDHATSVSCIVLLSNAMFAAVHIYFDIDVNRDAYDEDFNGFYFGIVFLGNHLSEVVAMSRTAPENCSILLDWTMHCDGCLRFESFAPQIVTLELWPLDPETESLVSQMCRSPSLGFMRRKARDGVAYTVREFYQWYGSPNLSWWRWVEAVPHNPRADRLARVLEMSRRSCPVENRNPSACRITGESVCQSPFL